jgi:superfamily II DNA or RNA helicase
MSEGFLSEWHYAHSTWQYFERAVARLLTHLNWDNVELIGGSGDKGGDIIGSYGGDEYVIQVKYSQNNRSLSVDIVGDVVRAMDYYQIPHGYCISNRILGETQKSKLKTYKGLGYDIESITGRNLLNQFDSMDIWSDDTRTPRPYQKKSIDRLIEAYTTGYKKALVCLATGMGKTFVAGAFLKAVYERDINLNVLILAHDKNLLEQFDLALWKFLPKTIPTAILHGSEKPKFNFGVLLSTFGSFPGFFSENGEIVFDIVIVDEAHHSKATTYQDVIESVSSSFRMGLTATPYRQDKKNIFELFGDPIIDYDIVKGMKSGFLSQVDYRLKNDNIDIDWVGMSSTKGYTIKNLNKKLFIPERDEIICQDLLKNWDVHDRKRGIIFCNSVTHAKRIEKLLMTMFSFPTRSLTNGEHKRENARRLREFRKGNIKILAVFDMLNEGIDVPDVDIICFMRVTHSRTYFLQQLGRGLRLKGDRKLIVLDYVADIRRISAVQKFNHQFHEEFGSDQLEELSLDHGFNLEFSDESTRSFLNLVVRDNDDIDEYEDNHEIDISAYNNISEN